jgi:hypothetical protein
VSSAAEVEISSGEAGHCSQQQQQQQQGASSEVQRSAVQFSAAM